MTALLTAIAIVGGTVHTGEGLTVLDATVVIEGERIVAVGKIPAPPGASIVDARGKVVTPGLIDAYSTLGLVEIEAVGPSYDTNAGGHAVRAAYRAIDSYNPWSPVIPTQRVEGVTTIIATPKGGLFAGQAAAYDLLPTAPPIAPVSIGIGIGGRDGGARGATILKQREVLEDARLYGKGRKAFDQNRFRQVAASRLDLEALQPVLRGEIPLTVRVSRRSDILTVLRLAEEERIKLILVGAHEAWTVADVVAKAGVGVILDPTANLPFNLDAVHTRADAATRLHAAGIPVAISTFSAHNVRKLRQWAGNAVREGLSANAALAAITSVPANLYGLKDHGRLAAGAIANVVVWSGDPFELSTRAEQVIIRGQVAPPMHRQRALFERYRQVPPPF